jgi:PAS domain S-box-containing protein
MQDQYIATGQVYTELAEARARIAQLEAQLASLNQSPDPLPVLQNGTAHRIYPPEVDHAELYQIVMENSQEGVFLSYQDGRIFEANPAACRILGYSRAEIISLGRSGVVDTADPNLPELLRQRERAGFASGELTFIHKDGRKILTELRSQTFYNSNGEAFASVVFWDITERRQAEEALKQYAALVEDLYNNAPCGYHSLDKNGVFLQINDTELNWLGYTRAEVVGKLNVKEILTPASLYLFRKDYHQFIERGWLKNQELEVVAKNGDLKKVLVSATALKDKQGQFLMSRSTVYDITELHEVQEELRGSEKLYRFLAENVTDMLVRLTPASIYTYVSPSCQRILGYRPEEMLGHSRFEFIHPEDIAGLKAHVFQQDRPHYQPCEVRYRHKDGHYLWMEISGRTLYSEETGQPLELITTARDISMRKKAEEELRESEEKFRQISENLTKALFILSVDGQKLLYVNPAFETITGRTLQSFYQNPTSILEAIHEEDLALFLQQFQNKQYVEEGYANLEFRILTTAGKIRWIWIRCYPIKNSQGEMVRRLMMAEDITRRKHYEHSIAKALKKEQELNQLKSRFVSMASHEFRTPLTGIMVMAESIKHYRSKMSEEQIDDRLDKLMQQVNHMRSITEDVLQLSRIQAKRQEIKLVTVDLEKLCQDIVEQFQAQKEYQARLTYRSSKSPVLARLDQSLIRQVITNLISNALKYSPAEKPVQFELGEREDQILLQVQDQGLGIPEGDQPRIFEPFHRAGNVGTIQGTGLGLSLTKELVEAHAGSINFVSKEGQGTTFTVLLPKIENINTVTGGQGSTTAEKF